MIFLKWHLGLGDAIICNGLVREMAKKGEVEIPAYPHNLDSVKCMFRDLENIKVVQVVDEVSMKELALERMLAGNVVLGLGHYSLQPFDLTQWDKEFYRHARIPWECRHSEFKCYCDEILLLPLSPFAFVHNDTERNFCIKMELLPKMELVFPSKESEICDWQDHLIEADEVHLIDSVFLCLAESLPLKAKRKVFHKYARPGGLPPTLKEGWEVLT